MAAALRLGKALFKRHAWLLTVVLCFAAIVYTYETGHSNDAQIRANAVQRRTQLCVLFERNYRTDALNLSRTYDYLRSLTPRQAREPLSVLIRNNLTTQEQDVRNSAPPRFCNQPGQDELPPVPKRPAGL